MDLTKTIAAWPWLRRLWRLLPGPLRVPLLVVGVLLWVWRRVRGEDPEPDAEAQDASG